MTRLRLARQNDLASIQAFLQTGHDGAICAGMFDRHPSIPTSEWLAIILEAILDGCFYLLQDTENRICAAGGLNLEQSELMQFLVPSRPSTTASRLLEAVERRAVQFGLKRLGCIPGSSSAHFFGQAGYRPANGARDHSGLYFRSLARRRTKLSRTIEPMLVELGVPHDYGQIHRLAMVPECGKLQSIGPDIYARDQALRPDAARQWNAMSQQARNDGVELQAVSAFRSFRYQSGIIKRKLARGQRIDRILSVSAPPGFSEHHSGRAIDITHPGYPTLEEAFEHSPAFAWLTERATQFGFSMTFPRDNRHGVIYEPWHWAWSKK